MMTFILIHGAWHGGWAWRRTATILRQGGHDVYAPSLTGLGDRSHLLSRDITLSTHVRDVTNLIESEDLRDVILVGHSYAGLVVAQAADEMPDRIASLVFVDAFLPESGKALLDLLPPPARAELETDARERGAGWFVPAPPVERLHVAEPSDRRWIEARLGPHPLGTFSKPSCLTGAWKNVPRRTYVTGSRFENPVILPSRKRAATDPIFNYYDLPAGHEIMIEMPDELARLLAG
jgi:pimeloyl-ACP methyl ester carboxylesterase